MDEKIRSGATDEELEYAKLVLLDCDTTARVGNEIFIKLLNSHGKCVLTDKEIADIERLMGPLDRYMQ